MQSSMIPWHIFLNALAQQARAQEKYWLDRWRFTNDGVFMAHEMSDAKRASDLSEGSLQAIGKQEKFVN